MKLIKGHGVEKNLLYLLSSKYKYSRVVLLTGNYFSYEIAKNISIKIANSHIIYRVVDEKRTIENLKNKISSLDIILAIGGGKVIDISKEISDFTKSTLIAFPTILSNDGLSSGLVVLHSANNTRSIYRKPVDYLYVDFDVISSSPKIFLQSAIGDIFSNYSALNDWRLENRDDVVEGFVEKSLQKIENHNSIDNVLEAIIFSGKSVELLKNSSAISGSEHLICHGLEQIYPHNKINHGIAVASISIFTLFIQKKLKPKHLKILETAMIPLNFIELFSVEESKFEELFKLAKQYRTGRKTVLNKLPDSELRKQLLLFLAIIKKHNKTSKYKTKYII